MITFESKVVLVTGGGSGIGKAAAEGLGRLGASVVVSDVNETGGVATVEAILSAGGKATFVGCDVSQEEQVASLVTQAVRKFGRLDGAFNNAGIASATPLSETPLSGWNRVIGIDLTSVWLCAKYEVQQMEKQGGGAIVNTASIAGLV